MNDSELLKKLPSVCTGTLIPNVEESEAIPVFLTKPKKRKYDCRWLLLWQDVDDQTGVSMYEQAKAGNLTLTDYRVRDYMFCKCDIENFVHFNQSEAARTLKIAQPHISAAIKHLVELGIILEGPKAGKFNTYRINPAVAFSGSLSNGIKAKRDIIRQKREGAVVYQFPNLRDIQ